MSPPEVWGPAVWTLFHTLAEKINPDAYRYVIPSMFHIIRRICQYLPCPDCSRDATNFLAKLRLSDYKTKDEFKNMIYLFHNWVNAKKRKPLFNYLHLNKYSNINLIYVVNNFISKYNTKGNMKLLAESFQRNFVIKEFTSWFKANIRAFIFPVVNNFSASEKEPVVEEPVSEEPVTSKEPTAEETVAEEPIAEEPIVKEPISEEPVAEEHVIEEPVAEEPVIEENVEESIVEEPVNEPTITEELEIKEVNYDLNNNQTNKTKKNKKSKAKK